MDLTFPSSKYEVIFVYLLEKGWPRLDYVSKQTNVLGYHDRDLGLLTAKREELQCSILIAIVRPEYCTWYCCAMMYWEDVWIVELQIIA